MNPLGERRDGLEQKLELVRSTRYNECNIYLHFKAGGYSALETCRMLSP